MPLYSGQSLLFIACDSEKEESLVEQIKYLVEDKGAKCDLIDNAGNTAVREFHLFCLGIPGSFVGRF